jgi:hypothetical protein
MVSARLRQTQNGCGYRASSDPLSPAKSRVRTRSRLLNGGRWDAPSERGVRGGTMSWNLLFSSGESANFRSQVITSQAGGVSISARNDSSQHMRPPPHSAVDCHHELRGVVTTTGGEERPEPRIATTTLGRRAATRRPVPSASSATFAFGETSSRRLVSCSSVCSSLHPGADSTLTPGPNLGSAPGLPRRRKLHNERCLREIVRVPCLPTPAIPIDIRVTECDQS